MYKVRLVTVLMMFVVLHSEDDSSEKMCNSFSRIMLSDDAESFSGVDNFNNKEMLLMIFCRGSRMHIFVWRLRCDAYLDYISFSRGGCIKYCSFSRVMLTHGVCFSRGRCIDGSSFSRADD